MRGSNHRHGRRDLRFDRADNHRLRGLQPYEKYTINAVDLIMALIDALCLVIFTVTPLHRSSLSTQSVERRGYVT